MEKGEKKNLETLEGRLAYMVSLIGTQKRAAMAAGISPEQLARYLKGASQPGLAPIARLAAATYTSLDWVWTGRGAQYTVEFPGEPAKRPKLDTKLDWDRWFSERSDAEDIEPGPYIRGRYPLISWVTAGQGMEAIDNLQPGDAEDFFPCPVACSIHTFVLRIRGDSMAPDYSDGELIFVDPEVPPDHNRDVVAHLNSDREATFKKLKCPPGEPSYLTPINPDFQPQRIPLGTDSKICGVVVFSGKIR